MRCLGHHPGDPILVLNDSLVPVRPLLPLAAMFPRASLAQAKVKTSDSLELISGVLWCHRVRLHLGSQSFRRTFGGCGRKGPRREWPVLSSLALLLACLHCVNAQGSCVV